jgi:hypothetical protein
MKSALNSLFLGLFLSLILTAPPMAKPLDAQEGNPFEEKALSMTGQGKGRREIYPRLKVIKSKLHLVNTFNKPGNMNQFGIGGIRATFRSNTQPEEYYIECLGPRETCEVSTVYLRINSDEISIEGVSTETYKVIEWNEDRLIARRTGICTQDILAIGFKTGVIRISETPDPTCSNYESKLESYEIIPLRHYCIDTSIKNNGCQ